MTDLAAYSSVGLDQYISQPIYAGTSCRAVSLAVTVFEKEAGRLKHSLLVGDATGYFCARRTFR